MTLALSPGAHLASGLFAKSPSGCKLSSLLTILALSPGAQVPSGRFVNSPSG